MPLEDVSDDQLMINWLRQAGHAHLLDEQMRNNNRSSPPQPSQNIPFGPTTSSNFSPIPPSGYPPPTMSHSSPVPMINPGLHGSDPIMNSLQRTGSFSPTTFPPNPIYGGAGVIPFDSRPSPLFHSPPSQFLGPGINQQQLDMDIEVTVLVMSRYHLF